MSNWHYCYKCETATPESSMVPYGEWNADAGRTIQHLACPCGEREDVTDAYECNAFHYI